jgi:hypothetical protein
MDKQMNDDLEEVFSYMTDFEKETVLHSIKIFNQAMAKSSTCCSPLSQ